MRKYIGWIRHISDWRSYGISSLGVLPIVAAAAFVWIAARPAPIMAQIPADVDREEHEWEPDDGQHQEEWYDPSYWSDTDEQAVDIEELEDSGEVDEWDGDRDISPWADRLANWNYEPMTGQWEYIGHSSSRQGFDSPQDTFRYRWAREGDRHAERRMGDRFMQERNQLDQRGQKIWISGEVAQIQTRQRGNTQDLLAIIETDDGRRVRTALGPAYNLRGIDLSSGDDVQVLGEFRTFNGRRILLADRLETDTRSVQLARRSGQNRMNESGQSRMGRSAQRGTDRIQGEIDQLFTTNVRGERHKLAELRTRNGRMVPVDLGPAYQLRRMNFRQGDHLTVTGHRGNVRGRIALIANRVQSKDQSVTINRNTGPRFAGTQSQGRSGQGGQFGEQREQYQQHGRQYQQGGQHQQRGQQWISGEITDMRTVGSAGTQYIMGTIETHDGRRIVADLGPKYRLENVDLSAGDDAQLKGEFRSINGRSVFVVNQIDTERQSLHVSQASQASQASTKRVRGEVTQLFTKQINGATHMCARIERESGGVEVVDLGPEREVRNTGIREGDQVSVVGYPATWQGESMVVADRIHANNRMMTVSASNRSGYRSDQAQPGQRGFGQGHREQSISGEATDLTTQQRGNVQHMIATIETDDGRRVQVDLGPRHRIGRLDLSNGARVEVFGEFQGTGDSGEFMASRINADGQTVNLRGR